MTPAVSASATRLRISSSVTALALSVSWPISRNTARVEASRSHTAGRAARETTRMPGATMQAIRSGLRKARCLGTSSPMITDR